METSEFLRRCSQAVLNNDGSFLQLAVHDFAECSFQEPTDVVADEAVVGFLDDTFRSTLFHRMEGSWHLLMLLEYDWSTFTAAQRHRLLDSIEFSFNKFADPMAWFVLSEVLGEFYCCERSFAVLDRLRKLPEEGPRSQIPHGYEHRARSTADPALRLRAVDAIREMLHDRSPAVRDEAMTSLQRLGV